MCALLSESAFLEPRLPAAWEPVLRDLDEFLRVEKEHREIAKHAPDPVRLARLLGLHDRLVERSSALVEPRALADLSDAEVERLFARSVLVLTRLKDCVVGTAPVLDTAGSRTLATFEADFYGSPDNVRRVKERLAAALSLSAEEIAGIEAEVDRDLGDGRRMASIVRAIRVEFGLEGTDGATPETRAALHRLFVTFFPDAPLLADEVELVATATTLFFCVPYDGETLVTPRFAGLGAEQQEPIRAFLRRVASFAQERFAHFPAFGCVRPRDLPAPLLERLAAKTGLAAADVAGEMGRLVTILPLAEVDKYLVHDVWGHGWQASLLEFEHAYAKMSRYAETPRLSERAASRAGGGMALGECFVGEGEALVLDVERFRRFVRGELAERLPVALTGVLAEMMADVVEFKLLEEHPATEADLASSSRFPWLPTKLDLTLQDLPFYFQQATKAFRLWAKDERRQTSMADELTTRGASAEAARAAVAAAVAEWRTLAEDDWAPSVHCEPAGEGWVRVNAFGRLALNFLGLHRAVLEAYRGARELAPGTLPIKSFKDLMVIGASVFFEADRAKNLWRVDEFLTLRFLPLCRKLGLGA